MKDNVPSSLHDSEPSTMDSPDHAKDLHTSLSDAAGQALDRQALREWFHLPRFNPRDGLDDYDGDYREFDPLGEVVTAHLRHRIRRLVEETPDGRRDSTRKPCANAQSTAPSAGERCPQEAAGYQDHQVPQADIHTEDESLRLLARMLTGIRTAACSNAREVCAVFYHPPQPAALLGRLANRLPGAVLVMGDRLPAAPGPAAWLGALAMGASRAILIGHGTTPSLIAQLRQARTILASLKLDPGARMLSLTDSASAEQIERLPAPVPLAPAAWEPAGNERDLMWQAVTHLHSQVPAAPDQTPLDEGAPFGAVALEASRCTLCMACVGACPTHALSPGSPGPQIRFRERDCTQCGRCRQVCPEQAVTLTPRICYDPRLTGTARVLHQEAPLCCSVCGTPFAPSGIVAAVTRRLAAHWMYQDPAARERLTMCRDCRIRSHFQSPHPPLVRIPDRRKK